MATLEDLEARVAALEAERGDYKAVLAAINALGANQREHSIRLDRLETTAGDTNTRVRSLEGGQRSLDESVAEIKDLLIRALDK